MWRALGLMSGTSLDGVDVCLARFWPEAGRLGWEIEAFATYPFPEGLRAAILAQLDPATSRVDALCELDMRLGECFAHSASQLLAAAGVAPETVDVIGSHGQTLWHAPAAAWPSTLQVGDGSAIAVKTGITTVCDFRPADMAAGGQGAPLVPYADRLLFAHPEHAVTLLNLGGIANVTCLGPGGAGPILAFDTGPANMVVDRFVERMTGAEQRYDADGKIARSGRVDPARLEAWLQHPFFRKAPPRSTGREDFGHAWADTIYDQALAEGARPHDLVATATALSVHAIAQSLRAYLPPSLRPTEVLVSGGGAHNGFMRELLAQALAPARLLPLEARGASSDAKEALAFALFGLQAVRGLPNHLPEATGASQELVLGKICPGKNFGGVRRARALSGAASVTEAPNPRTLRLDRMTPSEIVQVMADEEDAVSGALQGAVVPLSTLIERCVAALAAGGRLFYVGAGTSGRLGVLDASECPPTFSTPPEQVQGIIAGGDRALREPIEGAEDDRGAGARDLDTRGVRAGDVVVGLAASGRTPYVHGALEHAHALGAATGLITCTPLPEPMSAVDHLVELVVGPEVLAGSTRLKAGTVTKAALNMVTTATMVRLGKCYRNRMVDVHASNQKLVARARRMVEALAEVSPERAAELLTATQGRVKPALVMARRGVSQPEAERLLAEAEGYLWKVLDQES